MNNYGWLLNYLICPLLTDACSSKLELVSDKLRCECGALYDVHMGAPYLRPTDNHKTTHNQACNKYQEPMFVNMFALRQYGSMLKIRDPSLDYRQIFDIRGGAENFYQTLLAVVHPYISKMIMIADIGCGTGRLSGELAKFSESSHVIGIDYSPAMISRAKQIIQSPKGVDVTFPIRTSKVHSADAIIKGWGTTNCAFVIADGQSVPVRNHSADIVTCINVFHRVASPKMLLASIKRIIKPNGVLLVSNSYDWKEEFTPREEWFDCFDSLLNFSEWQKLTEIDGILYITPTYNRKFDLAVNHIQVFKKIG